MDKSEAIKELVYRKIEERSKLQRESLIEFIKYYFIEEKKVEFIDNRHYQIIATALQKVFNWEIKRLIVNIPPRTWKTELITKCFPVWALWNNPKLKFIVSWYSSSLTETFSWEARDYYNSYTYKKLFPRRPELREDQNTKKRWANNDGWVYYATGTGWTITWIWWDILIIDDPLNPKDCESEVVRTWINNWYHNVFESRLDNKNTWAIIIIMQRLHDDDLCWHLMNLEDQWLWEKREKIIIPSICEKNDEYRKEWESIFEKRLPIDYLHKIREQEKVIFSCQYQQNPIAKESQEFHEERFKYYDEMPKGWRIFTSCDPAFKKWQHNDFTAIITWKFIDDRLYILEVTRWKFDASELIDKLKYHVKKREPEKIGIEAYQAQAMIWVNLRNSLRKENLFTTVEDITQTGDKMTKIRKLVPLYRNWLINHKKDMAELEQELLKFPRGRNDDMIDALQMLYNMYELQPNVNITQNQIQIKYDHNWRPFLIN